MIAFIYALRVAKFIEIESRIMVARTWKREGWGTVV